MKIQEIYDKYKIMPNLQEHLLRVTGVAIMIVDNFEIDLDRNLIISACLFHDMGNIIKFDVGKYPESLGSKGIKYWENVKSEFIKKYGDDEHIATYKICREIGVDKKVLDIIKSLGFSKAQKTYQLTDYQKKICSYSDHRASPYGILTLQNKLADTKKRYKKYIESNQLIDFENLAGIWEKIEKQIFAHCKIKPEDITEEKVRPLIKKLREYNIKTI